MDEVRLNPKVEHPRCPYCHEAVKASDDKAPCLACMAWHHRACRAEHGRCAACGAPDEAASPPVAPRELGVHEAAARPWWRAEPSGAPAATRPLLWVTPTPERHVTDDRVAEDGPALPPPHERHQPLGLTALLGYLALLAALASLVVMAVGR